MTNERPVASENEIRRGPGQVAAPPRIKADIAAIEELQAWLRTLWPDLTTQAHDFLHARLIILSYAVEHCETDTRAVRETLQQILLNQGTGAAAGLSERSRRRLAALTGIALPPGYGEGR